VDHRLDTFQRFIEVDRVADVTAKPRALARRRISAPTKPVAPVTRITAG
jgi:hypothetical protein